MLSSKTKHLCKKAEKLLREKEKDPSLNNYVRDLEKMIEELIAYQIELDQKNDTELETIFKMSLHMICVADLETTTFTKVNPAFTEILGYSEKELLGKSFMSFIHPDDVEPTQKIVEEDLKSGKKVFRFENRYVCKDGSIRWLDWVSHPDPDMGVTYAVATDITERKNAENALKESEAKFRTLIEQDADALLFHDLEGNIINVNKAAVNQYKYSKKELLNMRIRELDPDYEEREDRGRFFEEIKFGKPKRFEARQRRKTGEIFPAEVTITKVRLRDKTYIMGLCRDISEQKAAREALQESREKLKLALESAGEGIWEWNLQTGSAVLDHVATKMLGYKANEGEKDVKWWINQVHPADRTTVDNAVDLYLKGESKEYKVVFRMKHKKGYYIWISSHGKTLHHYQDGHPIMFVGVNRNISDQVKNEEKINNALEELKKYREHLEEMVNERMKEIEDKSKQLERMNKLFVGREFRIKELREKVKKLKRKDEDLDSRD